MKKPAPARPPRVVRKLRPKAAARADQPLAFLLFLASLADPGWRAWKALP